jgi:hypothetical protein
MKNRSVEYERRGRDVRSATGYPVYPDFHVAVAQYDFQCSPVTPGF